jgi:hypothetical protein
MNRFLDWFRDNWRWLLILILVIIAAAMIWSLLVWIQENPKTAVACILFGLLATIGIHTARVSNGRRPEHFEDAILTIIIILTLLFMVKYMEQKFMVIFHPQAAQAKEEEAFVSEARRVP